MKLRNRKTGEIRELPDGFFCGDNLKKICEEWEDYEEAKDERWYWCVDYITCGVDRLMYDPHDPDQDEFNKSIGNYFDTREQAEKAVEKLKAIQRLKNYYLKFKLDFVKNKIDFTYRLDGTLHSSVDEERIIFEDMNLLFGGEE